MRFKNDEMKRRKCNYLRQCIILLYNSSELNVHQLECNNNNNTIITLYNRSRLFYPNTIMIWFQSADRQFMKAALGQQVTSLLIMLDDLWFSEFRYTKSLLVNRTAKRSAYGRQLLPTRALFFMLSTREKARSPRKGQFSLLISSLRTVFKRLTAFLLLNVEAVLSWLAMMTFLSCVWR